jgi:hypothetical protein
MSTDVPPRLAFSGYAYTLTTKNFFVFALLALIVPQQRRAYLTLPGQIFINFMHSKN